MKITLIVPSIVKTGIPGDSLLVVKFAKRIVQILLSATKSQSDFGVSANCCI